MFLQLLMLFQTLQLWKLLWWCSKKRKARSADGKAPSTQLQIQEREIRCKNLKKEKQAANPLAETERLLPQHPHGPPLPSLLAQLWSRKCPKKPHTLQNFSNSWILCLMYSIAAMFMIASRCHVHWRMILLVMYLDVATKLLSKITVLDLRTQPPCTTGWKIDVLSLLWKCCSIMWKDMDVCVLENYRPRKNFFSIIRASGHFSISQ